MISSRHKKPIEIPFDTMALFRYCVGQSKTASANLFALLNNAILQITEVLSINCLTPSLNRLYLPQ